MATKALFQGFALPDKDGNYFLRPDRLLGAFLLPASEQPVGYAEAKSALAAEQAADAATKERLSAVQGAMEASGDKLRALHLELHAEKETGADEPAVSAAVSGPADGGGAGDIELASSCGGDGGGAGDIVYSGLISFGMENTAALSESVTGGDHCIDGGDSSDEENKEGEMEKTRLGSRLHAAQQFKGSQILATKGRSSTAGRRSLESGGGGVVNEVRSNMSAEDTGGEMRDEESGRAAETAGAAAVAEATVAAQPQEESNGW